MRNSIKSVVDRLYQIQGEVQGYLNNCSDSDDERNERLENELESIGTAIDALEDIE